MWTIFLRSMTFVLYGLTFIVVTDNTRLLGYLMKPNDAPPKAQPSAKAQPLTTELKPKIK